MLITLKKEDSGLGNYISNDDCPIARAIKNLDYKSVCVTPYTWFGIKFKYKIIPFFYSGKIPRTLNDKAHIWAREKQENDYQFIIN